MQLLERIESKDYAAIADSLSQRLAETAIERDARAGLPTEEVSLLRESGLLPLVVPQEYGGIGATWVEALKVVRKLSKADGSIGQLYGNHLNLTALAHVAGTPEQKEKYYWETAQNKLFWANAINTRDTRLKITPEGDDFRVHGVKSFATGIAVADLRVFAALQDGVEEPITFVIPNILHHYGEFWIQLQAAIGLADRAAEKVQVAWDKDVELSAEERGEAAIAVFAAKALATKVGLDITTNIFEVTGTRSTATKYGFDRYWRDLRTFTLHDPVDYKLRDVGNWILNGALPPITQYS